MPDTTYILVAVGAGVVLLLLLAGLWLWRRRRSEQLHSLFGSEYERMLHDSDSRRTAERELERRRERVEKASLRDLDPDERRAFAKRWRVVQAEFVDRPKQAVEAADKLVTEVMLARGYPGGDFQQRVADASVGHGDVIGDYRQAREIAEKSRRGQASTEELRQSMVCYRAIFQDMLGTDEVGPVETTKEAGRQLQH